MDFIKFKEKIALSTDFTPEERSLILDALNLSTEHDGEQHTYPKNFRPGSDPWITAAWAIMDTVKPGLLDKRTRWMLGGMIAGALHDTFQLASKKGKK